LPTCYREYLLKSLITYSEVDTTAETVLEDMDGTNTFAVGYPFDLKKDKNYLIALIQQPHNYHLVRYVLRPGFDIGSIHHDVLMQLISL
jgi:hypothetical protein